MSNLNAIGLIMALFTVGAAVATYMMALILAGSDTVVTGVRRGVPISTRYRWLMIWHNVLSFLAFMGLYLLLSALGFMEIARNVSDENVKLLAYLCAGLSGFASFSILAQGTLWISHLVSVLRQAESH